MLYRTRKQDTKRRAIREARRWRILRKQAFLLTYAKPDNEVRA